MTSSGGGELTCISLWRTIVSMAERTIANESLYRLRPLTWEKATDFPATAKCSVAKFLGTGIEVRFFEHDGPYYKAGWHYAAPGFKGFLPAADRPEAKRLAVAALLEWIEEAFSKVSE